MRYSENKTNYTSPAKDYSHSTSYKYSTPHKVNKTKHPAYGSTNISSPGYNSVRYTYVVKRDAKGKIKRSQAARLSFKKKTGYPHGRRGYVIDHIIPLKKGGCDCPGNMQWQTIEAAKEKDKWE